MDFTTPQIITITIAAIGAAIGLASSILAFFKGRQKEKADAAKAIAEGAVKLMEQYESRLEYLERTVKEQAIQIKNMKEERQGFLNGVKALCAQLRSAGLEPVWEPKEGG